MANPVLIRELRGRWRRPITYIILFIYASVLAALMGMVYSSSVSGLDLSGQGSGQVLGHKLFGGFIMVQSVVWMLLATSLTATSIAGERERGLLQGILLSPVTPGAIVRGKMASALWFISLLLLVPMPIMALCFTLGGLSPAEFLMAFLLLGSTAFSGACLGLATSACHRRADSALLTSIIIALTLSWPPVLVALSFDKEHFEAGALLCVIYQAILAAAALGISTDALNNILPERETESVMQYGAYSGYTSNGVVVEVVPAPATHRLEPLRESLLRQDAVIAPPAPLIEPQPTRSWSEMPLAAHLNFQNPVMQREVRARLRRRIDAVPDSNGNPQVEGNSFPMMDYLIIGGLTSLFVGWFFAANVNKDTLIGLWIFAAMIIAAAVGALGFVREREQQTLQPLLLAMLSPREVLTGKAGAASVVALFYAAPLLPIVLLPLLSQPLLWPFFLVVAACSIWCAASVGLAMSWICRQAGVAVAGSIALVCIILIAFWAGGNVVVFTYFAPLVASGYLPTARPILSPWQIFLYMGGVPLSLVMLVISTLLLGLVHWQLNPSALEKDGSSIWTRDLTKEL